MRFLVNQKNFFFIVILFSLKNVCQFDVTIVGDVNYNSGMERIPITLISMLCQDLKMNHIAPAYIKFESIPSEALRVINSSDKSPGNVSILTNPIAYKKLKLEFYKKVPDSKIKIAYSMLESSKIPKEWVEIINDFFDAVVVPDKWLISVYQSSGVKVPIFVIPVPLFLNKFFERPVKKISSKEEFIFGCSAACSPGKNIEKIINAFVKEFGDNENVYLRLHSRGGSRIDEVKSLIKRINNKRIEFYYESFSEVEYIDFLADLDCYIQIAQGEGFSITPREALALGKPCIVSNNTTHMTICESGFVLPVKADIAVQAYYDLFQKYVGNKFDCYIDDVCFAMREVYSNYDIYYKKALEGRSWVQQYLPDRLRLVYKNLCSPNNIIFGKYNVCTENFLSTNSLELYVKYKELFN